MNFNRMSLSQDYSQREELKSTTRSISALSPASLQEMKNWTTITLIAIAYRQIFRVVRLISRQFLSIGRFSREMTYVKALYYR